MNYVGLTLNFATPIDSLVPVSFYRGAPDEVLKASGEPLGHDNNAQDACNSSEFASSKSAMKR